MRVTILLLVAHRFVLDLLLRNCDQSQGDDRLCVEQLRTHEADAERELEEHAVQVSSVDFEGPKRIMEDVLAQMGKISLFLVDNVSDLARQHNETDSLVGNGNGNAAVLYELATNSLNSVSAEFKAQLKKHLLRMKKVYDRADFGAVFEEGKQRLELELLEAQEIALLRRIAE